MGRNVPIILARRAAALVSAPHRGTASNLHEAVHSRPGCAFGVDPVRPEFYSLRQSRYDALAQDVSAWAGAAPPGETLRLLIVGCGIGTELRHLANKPHFTRLALSGTNLDDRHIYCREAYQELFFGDLARGYSEIRSNSYDIVVCEQVLEHLEEIGAAIETLARVLKPGGKAIVGVPIFPPPLHLVRKHVVPKIDAVVGRRPRGHRQAFTRASFLRAMTTYSELTPLRIRGFRVISGGLLRRLDHYRWWWRANRRLGELVPGACIEIQAVLEKPHRQAHVTPSGLDRCISSAIRS